jgi:hypothetical protein
VGNFVLLSAMLFELQQHIILIIFFDNNTVFQTGLNFCGATIHMQRIRPVKLVVLAERVLPHQIKTPIVFVQLRLQSPVFWVIVHPSAILLTKNYLQVFPYLTQLIDKH